ncbi:DNA polymerase III subunit chi [invertebrate metagenome]|uniref:DNA polymerase III subunit chi n=1 Tax=invertebrate metagenome TaxID=1711999 RepID=A0A2H9T6F6_9ZZZZ
MTQISFYILKNAQQIPELFACQLIHKAWRKGLPVHVHTEDKEACDKLDTLLWQWREDSFIPHEISNTQQSATTSQQHAVSTPVTLGYDNLPEHFTGLVINLTDQPIQTFNNYSRVCEMVAQGLNDKEILKISRKKFRFYQGKGVQPETFEIV